MYGPLERHVVHVLKQADVAVKKIMGLTGMSRRKVLGIAQEPPVTTLPPMRSLKVRPVGRPSVARPFASLVADILKEQSDLPSVAVLSLLLHGHGPCRRVPSAASRADDVLPTRGSVLPALCRGVR